MKNLYSLSIAFLIITSVQTSSLAKTAQREKNREEDVVTATLTSALQKEGMHTEEEDPEIKKKRIEKERIELENALTRARLERELADLQADISRLMGEKEVMALKWEIEQEKKEKAYKEEIRALSQQKEKLDMEVSIAQCRLEQEEQEFRATATRLDQKLRLLQVEVAQMKAEKDKHDTACQHARYVEKTPMYLQDPLQADGSLVISDRHISLNGAITPWKANYIVDRIQYFNNKDAHPPIFITIESSPGGALGAGAGILKAMENSQAPVYVIVKNFAASMAALIATLADKSYAYPNATILHHQPWTFTWGNVRELKEQQEFLQEWWNRLGGRVAKKMGVSLKKLDEMLYAKSARGDWLEFADHAKKLKWIDDTISGIQDSAIRELPCSTNYTWKHYCEDALGTDSTMNNGIIYLPPLDAKDCYYLYNPNNLYQVLHPTTK
mmetsp:Transcript_16846/g.38836  ORF Transcript_16846/g.38836 Transcript_16846/m.38836 type:complete len:441 (-) Transcript_16846:10544-11866(-)